MFGRILICRYTFIIPPPRNDFNKKMKVQNYFFKYLLAPQQQEYPKTTFGMQDLPPWPHMANAALFCHLGVSGFWFLPTPVSRSDPLQVPLSPAFLVQKSKGHFPPLEMKSCSTKYFWFWYFAWNFSTIFFNTMGSWVIHLYILAC